MRAVYTTDLTRLGFTGPLRLFEGPNGLERMFDQEIRIDWADPALEVVRETVLKKYCSLIHGQPVLEAVLDLKRRHAIAAADVASVVCETFQSGFDIAGGGSFGPKDHPTTKEQADYNLKYLIAAALLDDQVGPAQLEAARINAPDAQALLARVEVRPEREFTERYPGELGCRVTIRTTDGSTWVKTQLGWEGGLEQPLNWTRVVEKFHWLAEPYADEGLRDAIVAAVERLDERPLSELMSLLSRVERHAAYPAALRGIQ
jgi:2-methylcitrate dehydratase